MCKFKDFSATQILREINFGHFEAQKNYHFDHLAALNFEFLRNFDIFKHVFFSKNQDSKPAKLLKPQILTF